MIKGNENIHANGRNLLLSGEAAYRAQIKLWCAETLETIRSIESSHDWGIVHMCCRNGYLVSYGVYDKEHRIFTIEYSSCETGKILATRHLKNLIYSLAMNPLRND